MMEVAKHSALLGALAAIAISPAAFAQDLAPKTWHPRLGAFEF